MSATKVTMDGTDTLEAFRHAVLKALDKTSAELFGKRGGWRDEDLPALFRAVDNHTLALAKRHGIELTDE